jgi:hypothetical protein
VAASTVAMNEGGRTRLEQPSQEEEDWEEPSELRLSIDNVEIKVPLDETTRREREDFLQEVYQLADHPEAGHIDLGLRIEEEQALATTPVGGLIKEKRKMNEDEEDWEAELEGMSSTEISRSQ